MSDPKNTTSQIVQGVAIALLSALVTGGLGAAIVINSVDVRQQERDRALEEFKVQIRGDLGSMRTEMRDELREVKRVIYRPSWEREQSMRASPNNQPRNPRDNDNE